jgi:hypothetical protein
MANTKISALTTDSAPHRTNDFAPTYDASAVATKKVALRDFGPIVLHVEFSNTNLADATTYYFGLWGSAAATTTAAGRRIYIQRAGIITAVTVAFNIAGLSTSETFTTYVRLNNTTDTTLSTVNVTNASFVAITSNPTITVAYGDYFEIKFVTPTWVTNPTGVYGNALVFLE